jgi:hypothetical protein
VCGFVVAIECGVYVVIVAVAMRACAITFNSDIDVDDARARCVRGLAPRPRRGIEREKRKAPRFC